jgi:hypothetical protein
MVSKNFMVDHLQHWERYIFKLDEGQGAKVHQTSITQDDKEYMGK